MKKEKIWLYLDDVRTPKDDRWKVVKSYDEFVAHIKMNGLEKYETISLDHDLGDTAMNEYYNNVHPRREQKVHGNGRRVEHPPKHRYDRKACCAANHQRPRSKAVDQPAEHAEPHEGEGSPRHVEPAEVFPRPREVELDERA